MDTATLKELEKYSDREGILRRKVPFTTEPGELIVIETLEVPEAAVERVVTALHEGAGVEHLGSLKTYQMARTRFSFPNMSGRIRQPPSLPPGGHHWRWQMSPEVR